MKRKVVLILAIVCLVSLLIIPGLAGCTKRENVLKVLSVAEYIDPEQITAFEKYYKEITGEKITVKYQEVDTNELMYAKILSLAVFKFRYKSASISFISGNSSLTSCNNSVSELFIINSASLNESFSPSVGTIQLKKL